MMPLSQAIRLGSMMRPQAFGYLQQPLPFQWLRKLLGLPLGRTCALGAAYEAGGCRSTIIVATEYIPTFRGPGVAVGEASRQIEFPDCWVTILHLTSDCPTGCEGVQMVERIIAHLNDDHRWTREQIADWVESIERSQEPQDPNADVVPEAQQEALVACGH